MPFDPEWDAKFKGFLKKAGDDFKRAAADVKQEAERLMKEVQDPKRQEKVRAGVQEASTWAKKTADQLATLVEAGVKQAEGTLSEVVKQFTTEEHAASAPDVTPPNAAPPAMAEAPAPAAAPAAKKTIGAKPKSKGKAKPKAKATGASKTIGKKKKAPPTV